MIAEPKWFYNLFFFFHFYTSPHFVSSSSPFCAGSSFEITFYL